MLREVNLFIYSKLVMPRCVIVSWLSDDSELRVMPTTSEVIKD